jgi:uncharacterized protein YgbK (DUF1537 family)
VSVVIGAIADDYTGGTDVSVAFRRAGLRTLLFFGVPSEHEELPPHDALVIALKSRMIPSEEAVEQSLDAHRWLDNRGVSTLYFKYCSTFDSTSQGNIGPVLDALASVTGARSVVMTPSSPEHGRTQYQGHLFVGVLLLSESHMRNHPVTPMTDSNIGHLLRGQTPESIGLVEHAVVAQGHVAVRAAVRAAEDRGERYILADAIDDDDLRTIGRAIAGAPLVAGASGLAAGLASVLTEVGPQRAADAPERDLLRGYHRSVVLAGSCSARTLEQIAFIQAGGRPSYRLDAIADPEPASLAAAALAWYDALVESDPDAAPLIYSSVEPATLRRIQAELGVAMSAEILEDAIGRVARGLVDRGVTRVISAGGETSGAIVTALNVTGGFIGEEESRGIPWIFTTTEPQLALLLKSGNFGDRELLARTSDTVSSRSGDAGAA